MSQPHFTPAAFAFMRDLASNNDREWFNANKERYHADLRDPALRFITDLGPHLMRISPAFRADPRPSGGSLFRIYRDIRFSNDKRPYKEHTGIHFRHVKGKDVHAPGFYLHLEPGACFMGMGLWHADNPALKRVRDALVADPGRWRKAVGGKRFRETFTVSGDSLKRPPRGYDPEHPLVEILKLKDITAYAPLTQRRITGAGFLEHFAQLCRDGSPLMKFLCEALDLPY